MVDRDLPWHAVALAKAAGRDVQMARLNIADAPTGIGFFPTLESFRFPIAGYRKWEHARAMAGPLMLTESGMLYHMHHAETKRSRPLYSNRRKTNAAASIAAKQTLGRVLRWLERISPPKVLLTFEGESRSAAPNAPPRSGGHRGGPAAPTRGAGW